MEYHRELSLLMRRGLFMAKDGFEVETLNQKELSRLAMDMMHRTLVHKVFLVQGSRTTEGFQKGIVNRGHGIRKKHGHSIETRG